MNEKVLNEIRREVSNKKLNEGIAFFKDSKKLEGVMSRIREVISRLDEPTLKNELKDVFIETNRLRKKFKGLEEKYRNASKEDRVEFKREYEEIKRDSSQVLKRIRDIDFTNIMMEFNKLKGNQMLIAGGCLLSLGAIAGSILNGDSSMLLYAISFVYTSLGARNVIKYKKLSNELGLNFPNVNKMLNTLEVKSEEI